MKTNRNMKIKCNNCNKHKGTENWVGEGSMLDFVHGNYEIWCKCCTLQARLEHIEKIEKDKEKIKKELYKINCK